MRNESVAGKFAASGRLVTLKKARHKRLFVVSAFSGMKSEGYFPMDNLAWERPKYALQYVNVDYDLGKRISK